MMKTACPICGNSHLDSLITLDHIPYFENWLCDSEILAKQSGCGTQNMTQCQHCGFVFNSAFEAKNVIYGSGYHIERSASEYYRQHLENVAKQINSASTITGKHVLEVACGTGEFLRLISGYRPKTCIGVDPSANKPQENCMIRRTLFDETYIKKYSDPIDILISRHMIEHIENPLAMLQIFAQALPKNGILYLEMPRLDWILEHRVFYDFSYEHCSYFTDEFMARLLSAAGFSLLEMVPSFDGQYFSMIATKNRISSEILPAGLDTISRIKREFCKTRETYDTVRKRFLTHIIYKNNACKEDTSLQGSSCAKKVYLWGAGGKGVMCCNLLAGDCILGCVDKNPFKQGKFIPGTGHPVLAPANISYEKANCILVENDVYFDEIEQEACKIDTRFRVLSLNRILGISPD